MALVGPIRIRVQSKPRIRCRVLPRLIPLNASIEVGTVTTGAPGSPVTVVNSGTSLDAVLDFSIPQGAQGDPGVVQSVVAGDNVSVDSSDPTRPVVSAISDITPVADRAALKALSTSTKKIAIIYAEGGRNGAFVWTVGDYSTQVAADTAEGIYIKATAIAATAGAWVRLYSGNANASWFGTGQSAIEAAHSVVDDIEIDRPFAIAATATWPNGKRYKFTGLGKLAVATAVTLTIRGAVRAPTWANLPSSGPNKIFDCTGTGKVLGVRRVHPEWWGAVKNGSIPDHAAFQAAQNCIEASATSDGDETALILGGGSYALGAQVVVTPRGDMTVKWLGQGGSGGTYLVALASWTGNSGVVKFAAAAGINDSRSNWLFSGFRILPQTAGTGSTVGILIGAGATTLQGGVQESALFEDVNVYEFATCWYVQNARLMQWRRCGGWIETLANGNAFRAVAAAGDTTGDFDTYSCQFVGKGTNTRSVFFSGSGAGATVVGIRMHSAIMYAGSITVSADTAARVGDIWFDTGSQLDVFTTAGVILICDGSGSRLYNVKFRDGYFASGIVGTVKAISIGVSNSGAIRGIEVSGNFFINCVGDVVYANGDVQGYIVTNNHFVDCNGGNMVTIGTGVKNSSVTGNTVERMNTSQSVAAIVATVAGANYYAIRNNMGNGVATAAVSDIAAGAQKIVDGNF
ncbi:hypothetical protein [Mesorhizobium sp. B2-3-2]|uniref:hypothetical protein n=1 Tax=Mesorhizobium sp. B2-3-2 TaxID=2589961 RepID=UPI00112E11A5|nr:hypothetical protein [Mesorhizobium sp. B2-3-2]TPM37057.1 hypothetical protein FJ964_30450 [Mesorhizobium sp. B2-3-2]